MHILIVDSSRLFHQILSNLFNGTRLVPVMAESGEAALAALGQKNFDAVCSAYHLPDMSGIALCQKFRELPHSDTTPFMLLTSSEGAALTQEALAAGITEIFHRDNAEALITFLQRLLQLHEQIDADVLLVEDADSQRAIYKAMLESYGCRVTAFADAAPALEAFAAGDFSVVITDIVLSGTMSGIGLVNAIRRHPGQRGETPVLALTAFDDLARRIELFHLGVNDYVLKPVADAEFRMRVRNLAQTKRLLANLHTDRERAQSTALTLLRAIEQVPSGVAIANADGRIEYANPSFVALVRADKQSIQGQALASFNTGDHALGENSARTEHARRRPDGSTYWSQETICPVRDAGNKISHYIAIHDDTTEQRALRDEIDFRARHDHLTGLPNRRQLEDRLSAAIAAWHDQRHPSALAFFDIGNLRSTNDAFGFEAGDALLQDIAGYFREISNQNAMAARVDSGRLALLLAGTPLGEAQETIRTLLTRLNTHSFQWGLRQLTVNAVAGVSCIAEHILHPQLLFQETDSATQVARRAGYSEIVVFDADDPRIIERHGAKRWLPTLHEALENQRFVLHSQLIYPLRAGLPPGFEFLVRLKDSDGRLIPPGHFLPTAEHYGLMPQIDRWVVDQALQWVTRRPQEEIAPFYNINLSGQSLSDPEFVETAARLLRQSSVRGSQICFEVTESSMVRPSTSLGHFIQDARHMGCRFALDDFGSGFASYGQLKKLPVQMLKVDGQLVVGIGTDRVDRAMVKSIGEIGSAMNMLTVGEFVEDSLTLETLREIGIDYAQGYHLGRPGPLD